MDDYAIFIRIPGLLKRKSLKNVFLSCTSSGTGGSLTHFKLTRKHLQLSTDNKNVFVGAKCLHLVMAHLLEDKKQAIYNSYAQGGGLR